MGEHSRYRAMLWLLSAMSIAMLIYAMMGDAKAHQAPSGWNYPSVCCSDRDCRETSDIQETAEGFLLTTTGELVSYGDRRVKHSPDGMFHICQQGGNFDSGRILCLFAPPRAF